MKLMDLSLLRKNQEHIGEKIKINLIKNIVDQKIDKCIDWQKTNIDHDMVDFITKNEIVGVNSNLLYLLSMKVFHCIQSIDNYNYYRYLDILKNRLNVSEFKDFLDAGHSNLLTRENFQLYCQYNKIIDELSEKFI